MELEEGRHDGAHLFPRWACERTALSDGPLPASLVTVSPRVRGGVASWPDLRDRRRHRQGRRRRVQVDAHVGTMLAGGLMQARFAGRSWVMAIDVEDSAAT